MRLVRAAPSCLCLALTTHNNQQQPNQPYTYARTPNRVVASVDFDGLGAADHSPVGVLLLSLGAPDDPDDVEPYLANVFADPELLSLPPPLAPVRPRR